MNGGPLLALLPGNGLDLTAVVLAVIGAISSYVTPKLVTRAAARKAELKAAEDATDVSWVEINKTLRAENVQLKAELATSQAKVGELMAEIYKPRQPPST